MSDLGDFDATTVPPSRNFDPLPPGQYVVQIVQSEMRPTKDGNGAYLWLEMDILEGEHAGRKLWDRLNLHNQNVQAVGIAQSTLRDICFAVGKPKIRDSSELQLIPMVVEVKIRPPRGEYDASNKVRYLPRTDRAQAPVPAGNGTATAEAHANAPWRK